MEKGRRLLYRSRQEEKEYEVYLTNLAKTEDAYEVTVPFSAFKGKTGGKLSGDALKDVQAFGLWCNSDGLIAVKQISQSGNNGGNSSSGSSTSGGNSGSNNTDTKPSETRKTDKNI